MSVQRHLGRDGKPRYRARVKQHGRELATCVFDRRRDAEIWEEEQKRRLRLGEWYDPRRGRVPLAVVAETWMESRHTIKRNSKAVETRVWHRHIEPNFGKTPVASITSADVQTWMGRLISGGLAPSTVARCLGVFRTLLAHAVHDGRVQTNVAMAVKAPTAGYKKREGQFLSAAEIDELASACRGPYADVVRVLALAGLRWGELAGLKVGDRIRIPGEGLRLQRSVMASVESRALFEDSLKNNRSRTVPLVEELVPIVEKWAADKDSDEWLFGSPKGGPLSEANWKRSVSWSRAIKEIGRPTLRIHDLRHTCASLWLGSGADPKVVQRILGHASATMTMDLYGHLIDHNLWESAKRIGDTSGARKQTAGVTPVEGSRENRP